MADVRHSGRRRGVAVLVTALAILALASRPAPASASSGVIVYVDAMGVDAGSCDQPSAPCASPTYALSEAGDLSQGVTVMLGSLSTAAEEIRGTTTLTSGTVTLAAENPATVLYGGDGDALDVSGTADVTVEDVAVSASADTHTAVKIDGGTVRLSRVRVSGQYVAAAPAAAGAIRQSAGTLTVTDSTLRDAPAGLAVTGGAASVIGSAIGPNTGTGVAAYADSTVTIDQTTAQAGISASDATVVLSIVSSTVGSVSNNGATVGMAGSIIAGGGFRDCWGTHVVDGGYNVAGESGADQPGTTGSCGVAVAAPADLELGLFKLHGGTTATWPPASTSSAAIDQIPRGSSATVNGVSRSLCPSAGASATDQRAVPRPQGASCDIGALELASTTVSVTLQSGWPGDPGANQTVAARVATPFANVPAPAGRIRIFDNGLSDVPCDGSSVSGGQGACGARPLDPGVHVFRVDFFSDDGVAGASGQATETEIPPRLASRSTSTFVLGRTTAATFVVTGSPVPSMAVSGSLPHGLHLTTTPGRLSVSGTPASGTVGTYRLSLTAANWSGRWTRTLTVVVATVPRITSASRVTFHRSHARSFRISTSASPTAVVSVSGRRPPGLVIRILGGRAKLFGRATGKLRRYVLYVHARNAAGAATQRLVVVVAR